MKQYFQLCYLIMVLTMNTADNFGLFYQCLPKKSYQLKIEKGSGGKHIKIRITGLAAANVVGNKLPMFVTGKAKNAKCFKNIKGAL